MKKSYGHFTTTNLPPVIQYLSALPCLPSQGNTLPFFSHSCGIIHRTVSPYRGLGLRAADRMAYSRNFLLNIRICWKVWNNLCHCWPVQQIPSEVWARLKFLDLLAPRRGHRGGRSQSLFKDKKRIDTINGRQF